MKAFEKLIPTALLFSRYLVLHFKNPTVPTNQNPTVVLTYVFLIPALEGEGFGGVQHRAAFTKIPGSGEMFWWFYPTLAEGPETRPLVLWLDGVVGLPPSLLANFGMLGPFDLSLNRRNDSWVKCGTIVKHNHGHIVS